MALVEASIEGPIEHVERAGNGVRIRAMNVSIVFEPGPVIDLTNEPADRRRQRAARSPSQRLSIDDLLDMLPFPGRTQSGFLGGTISAEGFFKTDGMPLPNGAQGNQGELIANFVFVEPAEHVLIGAVTARTADGIRVNGAEVVPLNDRRLSTNPDSPSHARFLNAFGFEITHESMVPTQTTPTPLVELAPTAVEGFVGDDGRLYAHVIEYGEVGQLAPPADPMKPIDFPRLSIQRAQVRVEPTHFQIEIRGHLSAPPPLSQDPHQLAFFVLDMKPGTIGLQPEDWDYRGGSREAADITNIDTLRVDFVHGAGMPPQLVPPVQRWRLRGTLPRTGVHLLPPERIEVHNLTAQEALHVPVVESSDTDVREG